MKLKIFALTLLLASAASASDYQATVMAALDNIAEDIDENWAHTETTVEDGLEYVGRYDPRRPAGNRWELLTVGGRNPNADEIIEFNADKNHDIETDDPDHEEHDDGSSIDLISMDTLELLEETEEYLLFGFVPTAGDEDDKDAEKFMRKVTGRIKIIRNGNYPEYIRLQNEKPIRPAFGVKIKQFLTLLEFGPATQGGPVVPLSIEVMLQGRAMLAIKIDERELIRFSDYEFAGANHSNF